MSHQYCSSRRFFNCPPNCPNRKPACQDHCPTYLEKRAEWDALMAAEKKRKAGAAITIETLTKKKDSQARLRRNIPGYK